MSNLLEALGESEFKQFLDTLKRLGIEHEINWELMDRTWQKVIEAAGYKISVLGCLSVCVAGVDYVFSKGQAYWDEEENGYGPKGVFMLSRNWKTGKITSRVFFSDFGFVPGKTGLEALKAEYPNQF